MAQFSYTLPRGDTDGYTIEVTRDRAPLDLTGATLFFTAKVAHTQPDDSTALFQKAIGSGITVTNRAGGICVLQILPEDTNNLFVETVLYCDLQLREFNGVITTIAEGTIIVTLDVTRRTA